MTGRSSRQFLPWLAVWLLSTGTGPSTRRASFVGAERCKLCHRDIYQSWKATPHARPLESSDDRCLTCHATNGTKLASVQCEACHGAGSDYSVPEVMIDPEKAAMAGLLRTSIGLCERCHENEEPDHRGTLRMPPRAEWRNWVHQLKDP